jgi:hypothetical protein
MNAIAHKEHQMITSIRVPSTTTSTQILDHCDTVRATVITGNPLQKVDQAEAAKRGWTLVDEPTCCAGHGCKRCAGWGWFLSR